MPNKKIFVLKIVWRKSIASLHRLTQAVQRANLRRTAGDPTWVIDDLDIQIFRFEFMTMKLNFDLYIFHIFMATDMGHELFGICFCYRIYNFIFVMWFANLCLHFFLLYRWVWRSFHGSFNGLCSRAVPIGFTRLLFLVEKIFYEIPIFQVCWESSMIEKRLDGNVPW